MNLWGLLKGLLIQDVSDRTKEFSLEVDPTASSQTRTRLIAAQTDDRDIFLFDDNDTIVGRQTVDTLVNKSIDASNNSITNISDTEVKSGANIDAAKIGTGIVSNTEFNYLDGVTSAIQTQIDSKVTKSGDTMTGFLTLNADPTSSLHAVTKQYADSIAAGLDPKEAVRVASTVDIGGSYATSPSNGRFTGAATSIDGVSLSSGDRVLLKDQSDAKQNGIYVYNGTGQYTRSSDMDGSPASEVSSGNSVLVVQGTQNAAKGYVLLGNGILTLNTDSLNWTLFTVAAGASTDLSNLTSPTAINQDLLPGTTNSIVVGNSSKAFASVSSQDVNAVNSSGVTKAKLSGTSATLPSTNVAAGSLSADSSITTNFGIFTPNSAVADANPTAAILIETGNKSAGTGSSGGISFRTGTSSGGSRGNISFAGGGVVDFGTQRLSSVVDPTSAQDAATKNYVDLSTQAKTATYTTVATDRVILVNGSTSAFTINLIAAASAGKQPLTIRRTDSAVSNAITIDANGSETIDGQLTVKLFTAGDSITLISDGSSWYSLSRIEKNPVARYTSNSAQSIPASAFTIIDYAVSSYDAQSNVTTGASWKYTAKSAGKYSVDASALLGSASWTGNQVVALAIYKNGSLYAQGTQTITTNVTNQYGASVSSDVDMAANDFIDIRIFQNNSISIGLVNNTAYNHISISKIID